MKRHLLSALMLSVVVLLPAQAAEPPADESPLAIATFHCLGLYWSPPGGSADQQVMVRYRRHGESQWKEALPMRYNPIAETDEELSDYRGSIVNLQPATMYEVELTLAGSSTTVHLAATTWTENFPVGDTIHVVDRDTPLAITESGTPEAYRVYDGRGATIDVRHQHDQCITIDASYVIVRGLNLKGAGAGETTRGGPIGAIQIEDGHDIVIENCDISGWGRRDPETGYGRNYDSAVFSLSSRLERLIIQRCKMHHPRWNCSPWDAQFRHHTAGPQCITLFDTKGNHVIRYNECWSDLEHMYNDVIGGGSNGSFRGSPGPDSDIYGNFISHCWDDGLEVEGGSRNVRVWGNYITQSLMAIANAAGSIGPLYIWGNVAGRSQREPNAPGLHFVKMGFAGGERWMTGHMYVFHNTIFREDEWLPQGGIGGNRIVKHVVSRNNILHIRSSDAYSISENRRNTDNDFDYDLFNGRAPSDQEAHGVRGEPIYASSAGFDPTTMTGRFQLKADSPGAGVGAVIPNFSNDFTGPAPDMGAHQRGMPPLRFGVGSNDWVGAMKEVHDRFKGERGTLALFGDSITASRAFWFGLQHTHQGADDEMVKAFQRVKSYMLEDCWDRRGPEYGNQGRMTVRWAHENVHTWLTRLDPEVALIMFGTNDLSVLELDEYETTMREVVGKCLDNGTIVILSTIPPKHGQADKAAVFAEAVRRIARDMNIPLTDYHAEILRRRPHDWDGAMEKFSGYEGYDAPTLISRDGVHPSNPQQYANDYSEEGLRHNGYVLRTYLALMKYAEVIEKVLPERPLPSASP